MRARKVTYKERRPDGWSETLYTGLLIWVTSLSLYVLVTDLSHGLRVLPFVRTNIEFEGNQDEFWVEISQDMYNTVVEAFEADQKLQLFLPAHKRIIS